MRELKFRARKAAPPIGFVYGYFVLVDNDMHWIINDDGWHPIIAGTQEQFTGLYDRYKKRAFHNDIFEDKNGTKYLIDMSLVYKTLFIDGGLGYSPDNFLSTVPGILEGEIIGNIRKNPELLEE